jgi:ribosome-binding protein aMBF1 (putative translation factor)
MRFEGRLVRDGKWWLAEVPMFDALTQARSRKEAHAMIEDWFATMVNTRGFRTTVHPIDAERFEISSADTRSMVSLLLRRQRQQSGLSLAQVAERLGAASRNAYARYEQGRAVPTIEKLEALLRAICPDRDLVVSQSDAA